MGVSLGDVRRLVVPVIVVGLAGIGLAGCGPTGPTDPSGRDADPVALLRVLPSPDDLRGPAARPADAAGLADALSGGADPDLARRVRDQGLDRAAVREWRAPDGGRLIASVSVWDSHLVATGIASDSASLLLDRPGARAWTPSDAPSTRGARIAGAGGERELRLADAVGPNALVVRAEGPVDDDVVVRTVKRLTLVQEGGD